MSPEIGRRLIGTSAIFSPAKKVIDVDLVGLVRRLLLFDKYVFVTVRLQEFPFLASRLGFERLRDLLSANLIEIRCECLQFAQTGQSGLFEMPVLPLYSYRFDWLDSVDKTEYIRDGLKGLDSVQGLHYKQVSTLKREIDGAIRNLPGDRVRTEVSPQFAKELLHDHPLVRASVDTVLRNRLGLVNVPYSLRLYQDGEIMVAETDINDRLAISALEGHKLVEAGLMGVAGLSQTLAEMKYYDAVSGFRDEELPLFRQKLDFLANAASSQTKEANFQRVIDIAQLPDFLGGDGTVNVEKLLKIRDTSEAREFRDWLGGIGDASDAEIKDRVGSLRAKAGLKVGGGTGKFMRFLATTAAGFLGPIASTVLSALDQFGVDRLLPRSGIAALVNELYPSLFEAKSDSSTGQ